MSTRRRAPRDHVLRGARRRGVRATRSQFSTRARLLTPEWVRAENMNATVIADHFVLASALGTPRYASACTGAHIRHQPR